MPAGEVLPAVPPPSPTPGSPPRPPGCPHDDEPPAPPEGTVWLSQKPLECSWPAPPPTPLPPPAPVNPLLPSVPFAPAPGSTVTVSSVIILLPLVTSTAIELAPAPVASALFTVTWWRPVATVMPSNVTVPLAGPEIVVAAVVVACQLLSSPPNTSTPGFIATVSSYSPVCTYTSTAGVRSAAFAMPALIVLTGSARVPFAVPAPVGATNTASHGRPPHVSSLSWVAAGASAPPSTVPSPPLPCAHATRATSPSRTSLIAVIVAEGGSPATGFTSRPARCVDRGRFPAHALQIHGLGAVGDEPAQVIPHLGIRDRNACAGPAHCYSDEKPLAVGVIDRIDGQIQARRVEPVGARADRPVQRGRHDVDQRRQREPIEVSAGIPLRNAVAQPPRVARRAGLEVGGPERISVGEPALELVIEAKPRVRVVGRTVVDRPRIGERLDLRERHADHVGSLAIARERRDELEPRIAVLLLRVPQHHADLGGGMAAAYHVNIRDERAGMERRGED